LGTQETFCIVIAGLLERDSFDGLRREILWIWWLQNGVLQAWDEQLIGEEGGGYLYPPPPENLIIGCQESPAKAGVKSGYSRPHRLKPASTLAIAGLKNPALAEIAKQISGLHQRSIAPLEIWAVRL
jgi:hypothetical protein